MSQLINITDYSNATANIYLHCKDAQGGIIFLTCVTLVSFVFGFPGAVALFLELFQKGRKGTPFSPNDVFISNLTVMDGLYLFGLLSELYMLPHGQNAAHDTFISFVFSFSLCGRPLFITCICLECYLAVVHPATYRARKSLTPRVLMAVGVWTVTVIFGPFFIGDNGTWNVINLIFCYALTLPVMGFFDFSIFRTLRRSNPGGKDIHPQKKKTVKIIISHIILTFTFYLPPIITLFVSWLLRMHESTIYCLVLFPVTGIILVGNTASLLLHLNNLGKLDWLKCWKQK